MGLAVAFQTALFTALNADATLTSLLGGASRVYDHPPEGTEPPYLTIGEDPAEDWGANTFRGKQLHFEVHSWAEGKGKKLTKQLMDQVYAVLHETNLTVSGHTLVLMRFATDRLMLDPDGRTYHGVQIFRAILKEG